MKTLCFTAHRPPALVGCSDWWIARLELAINRAIQKGFTRFISGGALGGDLEAARLVHLARQDYPIESWIIVPCANQESLWNERDQKEYRAILPQADKTMYTSALEYKGAWQMWKRNRAMIAMSQAVIAVWRSDTPKGGTAGTVQEALKMNRRVYQIDPKRKWEGWL